VAVIRAIQTLQSATLTEVLDTLTALRGGTPPPAVAAPVSRPAPRAVTPPAAPVVKAAPPAPVAAPKPEPVAPKAEPVAPKAEPAPVVEKVVEKVIEPPVVRAPEPEPPKPAAPAPKPVENFWQAFVDTIKRDRNLIVGLVKGGVLMGNEGGVVTIAFPPDQSFAKEMLETHVKFMDEVATGIMGAPTRVKLEIREGVVAAPVVVDNRDPMEIFKDDPKIRRVLELFQGTLQQG
jgi:hypothetical protein